MAASTAACEAVSGRLDEETPSQTMATRVSARAPMATASSLLWCRCPLSVTAASTPRSSSVWSWPAGRRCPQLSQ